MLSTVEPDPARLVRVYNRRDRHRLVGASFTDIPEVLVGQARLSVDLPNSPLTRAIVRETTHLRDLLVVLPQSLYSRRESTPPLATSVWVLDAMFTDLLPVTHLRLISLELDARLKFGPSGLWCAARGDQYVGIGETL